MLQTANGIIHLECKMTAVKMPCREAIGHRPLSINKSLSVMHELIKLARKRSETSSNSSVVIDSMPLRMK